MNKDNFTMLCDFYELTMANGYFKNGFYKRTTYFDVFFRNVPDNGGFAIAAGLDQIIEYIKELHFSAEDIEFIGENINHYVIDDFSNISKTSDLPAIFTPYLRVRLFSRTSLSLP